jgi:RNA polymerase sigma factor (sigma-70 family)
LLADKEKFVIVIKENKRLLYKIINCYCKDPDDRQDLEQEILIQIWKSLHTYNSSCKLSTWLYRIALNVAISHYRKDVKRKVNTLGIDENILQIADHAAANEQDHKVEILYQLIAKLNSLNKALIILHLDGNSYKDIAEVLGISESNVGTKISRIKQILKQDLKHIK